MEDLDFNWDGFEDNVEAIEGKKEEAIAEGQEKVQVEDTELVWEEDDPIIQSPEGEGSSATLKEDEETPSGKNNLDSSSWKAFAEDLVERGILRNIELEDSDIDEDKLFELQEKDYEIEVTNRLKSFAEDLDEDGKAFLEFKLNGGKTEDFLDSYLNGGIPSGEISDEQYQEKLIEYQLKKEGWDQEEINDRIEFLTEKGTKEAVASKYLKIIEKEKKALLDQKKASLDQKKAEVEAKELKFKTNLESVLQEGVKYNGITIDPTDKALLKFMTDKTYKVEGGPTISGWQKKLGEVLKDPKKALVLGKVLMTDFDFSTVEKQAAQKERNKYRSKISAQLGKKELGSSPRSLADLF